ncbi:MAG TPA: PAS domain S-box protein [Bryobacteraceae bacterium]|nr:PAS domain S-box protein [Bryobacteraceae bacterium]
MKKSPGEPAALLPVTVDSRRMLGHFPEVLLISDEDWGIVGASRMAECLWQETEEQMVGRRPWEQWPGWMRTEIEEGHRRALAEEAPVELQGWSLDGIEGRLELRAFRWEAGIVTYYRQIPTDKSRGAGGFTDALAISDAQAHLAAIVQSSDDAIVSKDLNGIIRSWNRGAERIFGYTAAEVIGQHISMLAPAEVADDIPRILERIARGERIEHYQTKRKTKDGRILTVSLTISPVRDGSGRIVGASKVARDMTARQLQEQALREANAALLRSNADLQQFAYSASHDLKEPLRMVATYVEMLQRKFGGKLGESGDEFIRYAIEGAARMERLLADLVAYTQASTIDEEQTEEIDAEEILKRALGNIETAIKDSGASVTHAALPRVRMHEFQLQQIFQNLIANSIRYRSGEPPQIYISAERRGKEWLFSVQDNGIGIDPQYKEQIFGIFKRLHSAAQYPGTGMGLAICERLTQRAGGRIWVESQLGRGATFFFTVPVRGS